MRLDRAGNALYGLALVLGAVPLWATHHLPLVDLPQHLHLISVLHRLDDPTTLYPELFAVRGQLTPYFGYYYSVSALSWLLPLPLANRLFLTAYVVGMPLSLFFLLRSLGRPIWPSLLGIPLAYGDSFNWGFINYCAALPLTFVCCGLWIHALTEERRPLAPIASLSALSIAVLLFHVQAYAFLLLALAWLLVVEWIVDPRRIRAGLRAAVGLVPSVGLFLFWGLGRLATPATVEPGAPWRAWGPTFSPQNLYFKPLSQNASELFGVLANTLIDGSDRWPLTLALATALLAFAAWAFDRWTTRTVQGRPKAIVEGAGLCAIALLLFFLLPFDVRGYIYYLNTRYAHLAAALALLVIPPVPERRHRWFLLGGLGVATLVAITLGRGFHAFGAEAEPLDRLAQHTPLRPKIMGLIFDSTSRVVTHPVFLHSAAWLAEERGGVPNFSFASTPHSPLRFKVPPPPTFASEWRPDQFRYDQQGWAYDHFLVRGVEPGRIFGARLNGELEIAAEDDGFWLVRRR